MTLCYSAGFRTDSRHAAKGLDQPSIILTEPVKRILQGCTF